MMAMLPDFIWGSCCLGAWGKGRGDCSLDYPDQPPIPRDEIAPSPAARFPRRLRLLGALYEAHGVVDEAKMDVVRGAVAVFAGMSMASPRFFLFLLVVPTSIFAPA